jgi:hypothetical protein
MEITIQSTTKPENPKKGIKYNDAWHSVVGKAAGYVNMIKLGDIVEVREGDNGVVTFIQKKSDATREPVIEGINAPMSYDSRLLDIEEKILEIIRQNSMNNALIIEIAKKLGIETTNTIPASEMAQ